MTAQVVTGHAAGCAFVIAVVMVGLAIAVLMIVGCEAGGLFVAFHESGCDGDALQRHDQDGQDQKEPAKPEFRGIKHGADAPRLSMIGCQLTRPPRVRSRAQRIFAPESFSVRSGLRMLPCRSCLTGSRGGAHELSRIVLLHEAILVVLVVVDLRVFGSCIRATEQQRGRGQRNKRFHDLSSHSGWRFSRRSVDRSPSVRWQPRPEPDVLITERLSRCAYDGSVRDHASELHGCQMAGCGLERGRAEKGREL